MLALASLASLASLVAAAVPAAPVLRCALAAPTQVDAGRPVRLRFTVTNAGTAAVQLLRWNTPFESGWFAPFVDVSRDGQPVPYQGPQFKRGDPQAASYFRLAPGATQTAELDLAQPFDLSQPGRYRVAPRIHVVDAFDARDARAPRPRAQHSGLDLDCPAVVVTIVGAGPRRASRS